MGKIYFGNSIYIWIEKFILEEAVLFYKSVIMWKKALVLKESKLSLVICLKEKPHKVSSK